MTDDTIFRQAAIDALEKSGYCYDQFLEVEGVLNALPSARSCETCRYSHLLWCEEPCDSCTVGGESNHWKPKEPERRWIPCSERFPDDLAEVNVTWVNHDPEPYYAFIKDKPSTASAVFYKGNWFWYSSTCADILAEYGKNDANRIDEAVEITAWMPLPEPWKGEQP